MTPQNKFKKTVQNLQDEIFRKMPAEKKLVLAMNFFRLAKKANPVLFNGKTGRNYQKSR